jgi:predicted DNA-binding protein with PD1-like motif
MAIKTHAFRLGPGTDLKSAIIAVVKDYQIQAGWMISCVGSLTKYNLRFANQGDGSSDEGYFEIISLVGTLSPDGCHLHLAVADRSGSTIGGHLLEGCKVYTTAEIIIGSDEELFFKRETDPDTGWKELSVIKNKN